MREDSASKIKEIYEYRCDKPLTTYQKVMDVIGEITLVGILFIGLLQVLYQFLNSQRGFISATLLTMGCIWGLSEIYDISAKKHGWKETNNFD